MNKFISKLILICVLSISVTANAEVRTIAEDQLEYELLDFQLGNDFLLVESAEVYRFGDDFLLPFQLLVQLLELNLSLNPNDLSITGVINGATINTTLYELELDSILIANIETITFISVSTIELLFQANIDIQFNQLLATVNSTFQYPIQIRLGRETRTLFDRSYKGTGNIDGVIEDQYHLYTPPKGYFSLQYSANNSISNYSSSLQLNNDILYHSSSFNLNKANDSATNMSLSLNKSQSHPQKKLFGILNSYSFGDVASINNKIEASYKGAGIVFSNFDNRYDNYYGKVNIRELGPIDWQVELYKNGYLIKLDTVNEEGEIVFPDIDVDYGLNRFQLKFYGPYGEVNIIDKEFIVGQQSLRPGEVSLNGGIIDTSKRLFGENHLFSNKSTLASIIQAKVGVSTNTSLGVSFLVEQQDPDLLSEASGEYNNESILSINQLFSSSFLDASAFYKNEEQFKFKTTLLGSAGRFTRYNFDYLYDNNYKLESLDNQQQYDESHYTFNLSTRLNALILSLSMRHLEINYETYSSIQDRISFGSSFRFDDISFYNTLVYTYLEGTINNTSNTRIVDNFALTTRLNNTINFRVSSDFLIQDNDGNGIEFQAIDASINWRLNQKINMSNLVRLDRNENYQFQTNVSWAHDNFNLVASGQILNNNKWSVSLGISFNIDYNYHSDNINFSRLFSNRNATLDSFHYIDHNNNNQYDEFDEPLENVAIGNNQAWQNVRSDREGFAYVSTIPTARPAKVHYNTYDTRASNLKSKLQNSTYFSHPGGVIKQDVPYSYFADLDGIIVDESEFGSVKLAPIELYDLKGNLVQKSMTDISDNYYYMPSIDAGTYIIKVADEYLKDKNLISIPVSQKVIINGSTEYYEVPTFKIIDATSNLKDIEQAEVATEEPANYGLTSSNKLFDEREFFTVQFGAYNDKEYCALRVKQLKLAGIKDAFYSMATNSCKVLAGEFKAESVADEYRKTLPKQLLQDGFTTIYRLGEDVFSIQIAAFSIQISALTKSTTCDIGMFEQFNNIQTTTYVLDTGGFCKLYVGDFISRDSAANTLTQLSDVVRKGAFIVKR